MAFSDYLNFGFLDFWSFIFPIVWGHTLGSFYSVVLIMFCVTATQGAGAYLETSCLRSIVPPPPVFEELFGVPISLQSSFFLIFNLSDCLFFKPASLFHRFAKNFLRSCKNCSFDNIYFWVKLLFL